MCTFTVLYCCIDCNFLIKCIKCPVEGMLCLRLTNVQLGRKTVFRRIEPLHSIGVYSKTLGTQLRLLIWSTTMR